MTIKGQLQIQWGFDTSPINGENGGYKAFVGGCVGVGQLN